MNIVWWLLIGLLAGLIARLLVPGRGSMGMGGTLLLGLAGSLVGGLVAWLLEDSDKAIGDYTPARLLGSILGAILILLIMRTMGKRKRVI